MFTKLEIGQQIETTVAAISGGCIFLDLNAKSEGVLDKAEVCDENGNCRVREGERIKVFFIGEKDGEMRFTTKIAGKNADSTAVENAFANRIPVEGKVEKEIKGGFEVLIGQTRAFCPHSQMSGVEKSNSSKKKSKKAVLSKVLLPPCTTTAHSSISARFVHCCRFQKLHGNA